MTSWGGVADTNTIRIRVNTHPLPAWPPGMRGQEELRVSLGGPAEDAGASLVRRRHHRAPRSGTASGMYQGVDDKARLGSSSR